MDTVLVNFSRLLREDFELHVITGDGEPAENLDRYDYVHRASGYRVDPARVRFAFNAVTNYLEHQRPDLMMNVAQPQTLGLAVAALGRRRGIPSLVRMTGDSFGQRHLSRKLFWQLKAWLLYDQMAWWAYCKATHVLALGPRLRQSLKEHGIGSDRISPLPQPFDPSPFRTDKLDREGLKRRLGLSPTRKTILFVGRLSWLKGADRLEQIVREVTTESDEFQFCIVGRGEYESSLNAYSDEAVHLAGAVARSTMPDYYRAADLLIHPSRTEGLPNVVLEALAAGLPIMATPVGEIPSYVSATSERVEDYVDYIVGREWAVDPLPAHFDWGNQRAAYAPLLRQILEEGGP